MSIISSTGSGSETLPGFDIPVELHTLDKANRVLSARIRRVSPALFELSCSDCLRLGQRLALTHEGRRIEVEVASASQNADQVNVVKVKVVADGLGEVRSELRLPTDLLATVRVAGEQRQIAAKVVDMSPSGMGLELTVNIDSGAKVCIDLDQGLAFGEIRFCRQKSIGLYFAGFLLEEYIGKEESDQV